MAIIKQIIPTSAISPPPTASAPEKTIETSIESATPQKPIGTEQGHLQRLPIELLLDIMKRSSDFTTLWSIINTSSGLRSIFSAYAMIIIQAILDSSVPTKIQSLMSAVLCIRNNTFECPSWEHATSLCLNCPRSSFPDVASSYIARKFVHLAHDIHALAHSCIFQCIRRCATIISSSAELEPPSWIEEQRAILIFWRVQFFFELDMAEARGGLNWSFKSLSRLRVGIDFFCQNLPTFLGVQVFTALDFIDELITPEGSTPPSHIWKLPNPPSENEFSWICQARPSPGQWEQACKSLGDAAPGFQFFRRCLVGTQSLGLGGCRGVYTSGIKTFDPYQRLGFALWDENTMSKLGCWSPGAFDEPMDFVQIWKNILKKDEEIEHARRKATR